MPCVARMSVPPAFLDQTDDTHLPQTKRLASSRVLCQKVRPLRSPVHPRVRLHQPTYRAAVHRSAFPAGRQQTTGVSLVASDGLRRRLAAVFLRRLQGKRLRRQRKRNRCCVRQVGGTVIFFDALVVRKFLGQFAGMLHQLNRGTRMFGHLRKTAPPKGVYRNCRKVCAGLLARATKAKRVPTRVANKELD